MCQTGLIFMDAYYDHVIDANGVSGRQYAALADSFNADPSNSTPLQVCSCVGIPLARLCPCVA